jgi:hypothetical protein
MVLLLALALASPEAQSQSQSPRMQQYLRLAEATLRSPVQPRELEAALLSPEGVAAVRAFFERSLEESLVAGGVLVTPELGGEATLDGGRPVFVSYPDPVHPLVRRMVDLEDEPAALLEHLKSSPEGQRVLSQTGGLHALLYQMAAGEPSERQRALLRDIVASAVATQFKTWSTDPAIQARMIETTDWRGRYVGFWHIHPPRLTGGELAEGIEPSVPDMTHAVELGQFLTLVFQPDGFDAYDLSALALSRTTDLRRARVIRHRDPTWKAHFESIARARLAATSH